MAALALATAKRPRNERQRMRAAFCTNPRRHAPEAKGASEARAVLGSIGRMSPVGKVGKINKREVESGAHEARKLLGKRK